MGLQGQRAGLGSRDLSWLREVLFVVALYAAVILILIVALSPVVLALEAGAR